MKIRPVGAEIFHAGRRTDGRRQTDRYKDMMKLILFFHNSGKAPKNKVWTMYEYLNSLRIQIKYDLSLSITAQTP